MSHLTGPGPFAVIGVGSNIDPEKNIARARQRLKALFKVIKTSKFVTTKPIGFSSQPDFINGCILIETQQTMEQLKTTLKDIEQKMGRAKSSHRCGPRTIDLDIIVWNGKVVDNDFYQRPFIQTAVLELLPNLIFKSDRKSPCSST